ncbi:PorP/SprF family type IX secretion system membrane protein [Rasiella sp. SM2506]|uniref:PorP/SprF family type IX secretion system membrane protein n=1 Tax=Rasiella sp. SM2506 TaxID=3423914 RepID=UPI003D7906BE
MKIIGLIILVLCFATQLCYSQQEDGVVGLELPARNSLMFHRYLRNPTFSFVREQNKYIAANNKRELIQLGDAPQTYMANFSGRFAENIGAGIGVFQQNYGVLTTFGGLVNFAYNTMLATESNLTFGMNIGAYKSGINSGKVVTNFPDPSLNTIPSNFLLVMNPGINYGGGFMDFGVTLNNLVVYNFTTSKLLEENPKRGIQGHLMYTGYMGGYGFLEDSKFSALGSVEFRDDTSIYSGTMMLTVPKGFWVQGGYNSLYGASAGLGLHITSQLAIEYNYEKALGGLADFGSSHEFTLAYIFPNNNYFDYSRDEEIAGLISFEKKTKKKKSSKPKATPAKELEDAVPDIWNEEIPRVAAEEKEKLKTEEETRVANEAQLQLEAEEKARLAAEAQLLLEAEEKARLAAEAQGLLEAEEKTRLATEAQLLLEAEEKTRLATEAQLLLEAEEKARLAAEAQLLLEAEEKARLAAEAQLLLEAEEKARLATEAQLLLEAEEKARLAAEAQVLLEAEEKTRLALEEQTRLEAEGKAIDQLIINPKDELGNSIRILVEEAENSAVAQMELVNDLSASVVIKDKDLKNLKNENDLSEQGVYVEPAPFKSITEENSAIEDIIINLDEIIITQKKKIAQLEALLQERIQLINDPNDATNIYYRNALAELKAEQDKAIRSKAQLVSTLEEISIATDFERKRRIKRAAYTNEEDRYQQDRATLKILKQSVNVSETPLSLDDFDFGEDKSENIQILKNVENAEEAYYLVLAVHANIVKRDEFLTQVLASGHSNVDFFYDVNTSKYYIYYGKYETIETANDVLKIKGNEPFTEKLSIIKLEK